MPRSRWPFSLMWGVFVDRMAAASTQKVAMPSSQQALPSCSCYIARPCAIRRHRSHRRRDRSRSGPTCCSSTTRGRGSERCSRPGVQGSLSSIALSVFRLLGLGARMKTVIPQLNPRRIRQRSYQIEQDSDCAPRDCALCPCAFLATCSGVDESLSRVSRLPACPDARPSSGVGSGVQFSIVAV